MNALHYGCVGNILLLGFFGLSCALEGATLHVERAVYAPSEQVIVTARDMDGIHGSAWAGIIPARISHGDEGENNKHDIQYKYASGLNNGRWVFNPVPEGEWTVRLNHGGRELASAPFRVSKTHVPPGQNAPELVVERKTYAPSEKVLIHFKAPTAYPSGAWVGMIPADKPHGSEAENNKYDVQYQYLSKRGEGQLTFNAMPEGKWTARLNVWGIETASVDFEIGKNVIPPGQNEPELGLDRNQFAPSEEVVVRFKAPTAYPSGAWVGIIPADKPHGDEGENNKHDVQYQYLSRRGEGELTFNALPPGKWSARLNVWGIETASVGFVVEQNIVPPGQNTPSLSMSNAAVSAGEKFVVGFKAPTAYPSGAWVGIIPADKPHGNEGENNKHDVQYQYLSRRGEGELTFNALPPGKWSARLNVWGVETASIDFEVVEGQAPRRGAVQSKPTATVAVERNISSKVKEDAAVPPPAPVVKKVVEPKQENGLGGIFGELEKAVSDLDAIFNGSESADEVSEAEEAIKIAENEEPDEVDELSESFEELESAITEVEDLFGSLFGKKKKVSGDKPKEVVSKVEQTKAKETVRTEPEKVASSTKKESAEPVAEYEPPQGVEAPTWMKDLPDLPQVAPIQLSGDLDLRGITREAYAGMVSHAREGLAELLGPMTPEQQKRYDASWQPMYSYPAAECVEYLEKVVPVIEDILRLRPALAEYMANLQQMWVSAGYAELYAPESARAIMEQALPTLATVKSMKAALAQSMNRLDALGDPPDPGVLQQAAAERHRRAMRTLESLLLGTQSLEGYFELQQEVRLDATEPGTAPFYAVTHRTKGLVTRAITPFGGSQSDLVLFSDYFESDVEEDESSIFNLDFDFGPWSTWFAEPTQDGWASYDYDEEEDWLDVTYYRVEVDRLLVDQYTINDGKVEGVRQIFHKAPIEAAPNLYGEEVDPKNPQGILAEHREDLAESEAAFRKAKLAFQAFLKRGGNLPPLPEPDQVYWVLKDVQVKVEQNPQNRQRAYASPGVPCTYIQAEEFDYGPNHLSATWRKVDLEWEYPQSGGSSVSDGRVRIVDPSSEFIAAPDEEDIAPISNAKPVEVAEVFGAAVQWSLPPAVMPDGANWLMDPRIEGDDTVLGVDKLVTVAYDGFGLIDPPYARRSLFGDKPMGIQLSKLPFHADEEPGKAAEDAAAAVMQSGDGGAQDLVISLRSRRMGGNECTVPVLVVTPAGYLQIHYIYQERVMDADEAVATANQLEGGLVAATFSDVKRSSDEGRAFSKATIAAEKEAAELDRQRRELHKANIAWARMEAQRLESDMKAMEGLMESGEATKEDIERYNQLRFRHVSNESMVINEQDRIKELDTGELVHSRTPFDDYCRVQMINKCQDSARELSQGIRARKKMEYLMNKVSPEQRRIAIGIMNKMVSEGKGLYAEDYEGLNVAMQNIFQGDQEFQQAKIDEEIAWENAWVEGAEYVKTGADIGLAVTSMGGGPMYVNVLYQAGSGYIDKGPMEGLKRAVTTYSDAVDIAVSGYDGWKNGGFWGAVEGASFSLLMNKGPEAALGRMNLNTRMGGGFDGGFGKINVGKAPDINTKIDINGKAADINAKADVNAKAEVTTTRAPDGKAPEMDAAARSRRGKEAIEAAKLQQEMEWGETLAKDAFSDYTRMRTAEIKGDMDPGELSVLRMQVRQKMCAVGNSMTAKSYLKYRAPGRMGKAYTEIYGDVLDDAVTAYRMGMREAGFNDQKIAQYRNASSMDAGMDADLGVVEAPEIRRIVGKDGKVTYRKVATITKNGKRVPMRVYQDEGSKIMAEAFRKVSGGYSAKGSFVDLTTRVHGESYKDLAWLGLPKAGPHSDIPNINKKIDQAFGKIDPDLTPNSLGITLEKAEIMMKQHPELTPLGSMMEGCRGTAKDLDTKFIPLVDSKIRKLEATPSGEMTPTIKKQIAELKDTKDYLAKVSNCFGDIGKGRTHPGRWMEDFRQVTGGNDPIAVTRRLVVMTSAASRM